MRNFKKREERNYCVNFECASNNLFGNPAEKLYLYSENYNLGGQNV